MAVSKECLEFIGEALEEFDPVDMCRMFGGAGVFRDGLMFGLIAEEQLYFKVDEHNLPDFEAEDCAPFVYETKNGKRTLMSYSLAPERLYDDKEDMGMWARKAFDAALRADSAKKSPRKRILYCGSLAQALRGGPNRCSACFSMENKGGFPWQQLVN